MTEPRAAQHNGARFLIGAAWLGAAAANLCFCVNLLFVEDRAALWTDNQMDPIERRLFVVLVIVSALLPGVFAALTIRWRSFADVARLGLAVGPSACATRALGADRPASRPRKLHRKADHGVELHARHPAFCRGHRDAIPRAWIPRGAGARPHTKREPMAVALAERADGCGLCLSRRALLATRHHQMRSDAYDLGIFDNMMWH